MATFEFKSAICTTKEQSERLLKLGINKETADMWYPHFASTYPIPLTEGEVITDRDIPAWSLHRLMEIVMKGYKFGCITHNIHQNNISSYYELVIASIENLIKIDEFNPEYLENSNESKIHTR